jgi:hypothetical protein
MLCAEVFIARRCNAGEYGNTANPPSGVPAGEGQEGVVDPLGLNPRDETNPNDEAVDIMSKLATDAGAMPAYHAPSVRGTPAPMAMAENIPSRLYREAISAFDPLGAMPVEDYYRDPAAGHTPQYAPRDFTVGGALDYTHHLTGMEYERGTSAREYGTHEFERYGGTARETRYAMRGAAESAHIEHYLSEEGQRRVATHTARLRRPSDPDTGAAFRDLAVPRHDASAVPSWSDIADHARSEAATANSFTSRATISDVGRARRFSAADYAEDDTAVTETFSQIHGLKDREAFEEDRLTRRSSMFAGYDPDLPGGRTSHGVNLPVTMSPSAMGEAQAAIRANSTSTDAEIASKLFASNTSEQVPAVGAALTERIARAIETGDRDRIATREDEFRKKHGFGRAGQLVSEAGPDVRRQQLHKNDERLLRAYQFAQYEYADGDNNRRDDPMRHNSVADGVGHLLTNKFDIDRRVAMMAKGKVDPLERSEMFYGVPIKQRTDHSIRYNGNKRFERHVEYFKPHPTLEDMALHSVYTDTAGFPLLRGIRTEAYEFELFARYRAHHQQRRQLALKHGLEPRPNETVEERDARRAALDKLCEQTPFDEARMSAPKGNAAQPSASVLRQWFGAYWLPSPTLVSQTLGTELHVGTVLTEDRNRSDLSLEESGASTAMVDTREHLLSMRYVNRIMTIEALNSRLMRGYIKETIRHAPETEIRFRQQLHITKHFTSDQRRMYDEYIAMEAEKHLQLWQATLKSRRYVADRGDFATPENFFAAQVVVVKLVETGQELCLGADAFNKAMDAAPSQGGRILVDGQEVIPVPAPDSTDGQLTRTVQFVEIKFATSTETVVVTEAEWTTYPEEAMPRDPNAHITNSMTPYPYNRTNYIETQDFVWEQRTATGAEGWTPALATDELFEGLPVLACRVHGEQPTKHTAGKPRRGEPERAVITSYQGQPFFNPDPKLVTVRFASDDSVAEVPLRGLMVWQVTKDGPRRNMALETREHHGGAARYIDFADPKERSVYKDAHFLDKYRTKTRADVAAKRFSRMRNVLDIDNFNELDFSRSENHRLLSISHRRDYLTRYFNRYTPWEFILHQEADVPMIKEQRRQDSMGPSYFHAPNRFWLHKRRPFGQVKNHYNEVRDLFQWVDGIVPWEKAKRIRSMWEVREHHPTPYFNTPQLAVHRNSQSLLPNTLWETNKRLGFVAKLKDTMRDYRPPSTAPAWSEL